MNKVIRALSVATSMFLVGTVQAASIDVLWYGQSASYNDAITNFASGVSSYDPAGNGSLSWNVTVWDAGSPAPAFASYDVFVIGSGAAFGMGFDPTRILSNGAAISAARGDRTFLSGQDADWHVTVDGHTLGNDAAGFLVNAVNWAGSGNGLGIVALPDGWAGSGSSWWMDDNSFLKSELNGYVSYFQEESVVIPGATAGYPVNEGLTTDGLSNWGTSSHLGFDKNIPDFTSINDAGGRSGFAVTVLTTTQAGGGTTGGGGTIPEPGTLALLSLALLGLAAKRRSIH